jgi:septal ring factor EnvC (AmiA/AmiB activator)
MAADEPEASESRLTELSNAISRLTDWIKGAEGRKSDLDKQLKQSELDLSRLSKEMAELKNQQQNTKDQINDLERQSASIKLAAAEQKAQVIKQIQAAHRMGTTPATKAILSASDPHHFSRITIYMDYVNIARKQKIAAYMSSLAHVQKNSAAIIEKNEFLKQQESTLLTKQKEQAKIKIKRAETLVKLEKELGQSVSQLDQLKQDRIKLEAVIETTRKALADIKIPTDDRPFNTLKAKLPWPTQGKVIGAYRGAIGNSSLRSNGITIKATPGQPIIAIHHGQIVFSDWLRGFGLMIIVDHGNGFMSLYGHNDTLQKDSGDWVQAGEIIASAGNSGGAQESSLYFEIRKDGAPQNPLRWLQKRN